LLSPSVAVRETAALAAFPDGEAHVARGDGGGDGSEGVAQPVDRGEQGSVVCLRKDVSASPSPTAMMVMLSFLQPSA